MPPTTIDETIYYWEVQPGEGLNSIARRYCVPYNKLLEANQATLPDPNLLQVGQMLEIPKGHLVIDCVVDDWLRHQFASSSDQTRHPNSVSAGSSG